MLRLALFLIKRAKLSPEDRNKLASVALGRLEAIPIKDIISHNKEGSLMLNGREIDIEVARLLKEGAIVALSNKALQIINESVKFQAFAVAAINAKSSEDLLFGKAAIWFGQQQEKMLKMLAGEDEIRLDME